MENKLDRMLELRRLKKSTKPVFVAQDSWKRKEVVQGRWRRPKGLHSKIRLSHSGNPRLPSPGFRSPKAVRGFHHSGLKERLIHSAKQLSSIKDEGIIVASSVGMKKRLEILKSAVEKKITVLNIDANAFIKKAEERLSEKKMKNSAEAKAKAPKKPEKAEASKEEKKDDSEEEKRKAAKKEMEKIITKRG